MTAFLCYTQLNEQQFELYEAALQAGKATYHQDVNYEGVTHILTNVPDLGLVCDGSDYGGSWGNPLLCPEGTTLDDIMSELKKNVEESNSPNF